MAADETTATSAITPRPIRRVAESSRNGSRESAVPALAPGHTSSSPPGACRANVATFFAPPHTHPDGRATESQRRHETIKSVHSICRNQSRTAIRSLTTSSSADGPQCAMSPLIVFSFAIARSGAEAWFISCPLDPGPPGSRSQGSWLPLAAAPACSAPAAAARRRGYRALPGLPASGRAAGGDASSAGIARARYSSLSADSALATIAAVVMPSALVRIASARTVMT